MVGCDKIPCIQTRRFVGLLDTTDRLLMAETSTAQQMRDQEMIAQIGHRDQGAFSALYDRLSGPLYSLAFKMLGDASEAQQPDNPDEGLDRHQC